MQILLWDLIDVDVVSRRCASFLSASYARMTQVSQEMVRFYPEQTTYRMLKNLLEQNGTDDRTRFISACGIR